MRSRMVAAFVVVGLALSGGFALAHPSPPSAHSAAASSALTWKLVNSKCSDTQQAVGRACWDRGATDPTHWMVNEDSATWTETSFNAQYTYNIPDQIPGSGGMVHLAVGVNDVSNGSGIDEQLCVQSPFTIPVNQGPSDPCAHAFARTLGSSASGDKDMTLFGGDVTPTSLCPNSGPGSQPECVTLTIEIGSGGNLYFTYQASPAPKITYSFQGHFKNRRGVGELTGSGNFQLVGTPDPVSDCVKGINDHGSAELRIHKLGGPIHVVNLQSFEVKSYCPDTGADVEYRVTKSPFACLPRGDRVVISFIHRRGGTPLLLFEACGFRPTGPDPVITINST